MSPRTMLRLALAGLFALAAVAIVIGIAVATDDAGAGAIIVGVGVVIAVTATIGEVALRVGGRLLRAESDHRALTKRLGRDVAAFELAARDVGGLTVAVSDLRARVDQLAHAQRAEFEAQQAQNDRRADEIAASVHSIGERVDERMTGLTDRLDGLDRRASGRDTAVHRALEALSVRVGRLSPEIDAPPEAYALADHLLDSGWPTVAIDDPVLRTAVRALVSDVGRESISALTADTPAAQLTVVAGNGTADQLGMVVRNRTPTVVVTSGDRAAEYLERLVDGGYSIDRRVGRHGELAIARHRPRPTDATLTGPPVNVFVLSTGRSGTSTFSRACSHFTNFSAGHESRARLVGDARLSYPPMHIEADNRLSWMLGPLGERYDDRPVLYVHLIRDRAAVLASLLRRWDSPFRANITRAVGYGIITRTKDWDPDEVVQVCNFFIDTVLGNIDEFLRTRPSMTMHLETITDDFGPFIEAIGAEGDLTAAYAELGVRHNAS